MPEFADAAFKLKPGEISDPVKTQFGWHIIKVEDTRTKTFPPFEQLKDQAGALRRPEGAKRADRRNCTARPRSSCSTPIGKPMPAAAAAADAQRRQVRRGPGGRGDSKRTSRSASVLTARAGGKRRRSLLPAGTHPWPPPPRFRRSRRRHFPTLPPIAGVRFATGAAGVRYAGRTDVMLALFDAPAAVAGVFTRSKCPSAPVDWCRAASERRQGAGAGRQFRQRQRLHRPRPASTRSRSSPTPQRRRSARRRARSSWPRPGVIGEPLDADADRPRARRRSPRKRARTG